MERIDGILCISYAELVKSEDNPMGVMSLAQYKKRYAELQKKERGGNGRTAMIIYDSLPLRYRQAWEALHGDPRDNDRQPPMVDRLRPDWVARDFYAKHIYGAGKTLKPETQLSYSQTADIFNVMRETIEKATDARNKSRYPMRDLWSKYITPAVMAIREKYTPNDIPSKEIPLKRKYEKYITDGYESLIHGGFANKNRSNIDAESEAHLLKIASSPARFAAPTAVEAFNLWATVHGKPTITERTYNNFIKENEYVLKKAREGAASWNNMFDENILRDRPSAPLLLINSDDNNLDFFFKATRNRVVNGEIKTVNTDYYRYKMYLVMDPHCDYILGYAIGDEITVDLVVEAYRNAMNHVKEITGGYYMWHQIVADNWGRATLKAFYQRQAKTTLAQVGNAKSKYIERFFGIEWHEEQKRFGNHSGYNIVAKTKPNPDWIETNKKNFPTKEEGVYQIAKFVERLRNKKWQDTGKARRQVWLENFFANEKSKQNAISDYNFLDIFGIQRYKKGGEELQSNRITNNGIDITYNGDKYTYKVPSDLYRATIGKDAYTIVDPADMSRVLIRTADSQQTFVAQIAQKVASCFADMTLEGYTLWHSQLQTKDERKKAVDKELAERTKAASDFDIETYLQVGDLTKELNQKMQDAYIASLGGESIHNIITH